MSVPPETLAEKRIFDLMTREVDAEEASELLRLRGLYPDQHEAAKQKAAGLRKVSLYCRRAARFSKHLSKAFEEAYPKVPMLQISVTGFDAEGPSFAARIHGLDGASAEDTQRWLRLFADVATQLAEKESP